jgi:predicted RNA-binding Zn-ribbon protein involved in translation (DUF1610 family)
MNATERTAYESWVTTRPNAYGSALQNAVIDGFRLGVAYGELVKQEVECDGCGNRVEVPTVGDTMHPRGLCPRCGEQTLPREQHDAREDASYHREAWS